MLSVLKIRAGAAEPLARGPTGWTCSEGDLLVFQSTTRGIPKLTVRGETISPETLARQDELFQARFERRIDTWAGRTTFVMESEDEREEVVVAVDPHRNKLGRDEWEALIAELSEISQSLPWGMGQGESGGRAVTGTLAAVHLAIIEYELPVFIGMLRRLIADPPLRTLRVRTVRPIDGSRAVDLGTIRWLARRPLELAGVRGEAPADILPNARALVDQPSRLSTRDHPMTRYAAFLIATVRRRLQATVRQLQSARQHGVPDPAVAVHARQLARRVGEKCAVLDAIALAPIFRDVVPEPASDSVLQSLPDQPLFAAIHRSGRRLASPGLAYGGDTLFAALKQSFDLFEIAVLYRLHKAIGERLAGGWTEKHSIEIQHLDLEDRPDDGAWIWQSSSGARIELAYQPRFSGYRAGGVQAERSSLSSSFYPDYVLLHRDNTGRVTSWLILDAKYRSSHQSINDGLADIHRYRDALRLQGTRAEGAYILVPAIDPNAARYTMDDYLRAHQFGVLVTEHAGWLVPIEDWLQALSEDRGVPHR